MHDDGIGHVKDPIALRTTPPRVFVVLGVLQPFVEAALGPNVLANATAGHAEEMFPSRRFAVRAKTTLVIVGVNCPAVQPRDLTPEDGTRLQVKQRAHKRSQPIWSLRR